ncbi:MAG: hypothetical protein EOP83_20045 [Verrucomicrobiaceae bacterium]|nr:MAG: hypothetical protein EOP83_20045 [Verrucomicrobiaceae bacterium]
MSAEHRDPYSFIHSGYDKAQVVCVLIRMQRPQAARDAHISDMTGWAVEHGEGAFTYIHDRHNLHWVTVADVYDVSLGDWMLARGTHEMFLFNDPDTAFAFKIQFA